MKDYDLWDKVFAIFIVGVVIILVGFVVAFVIALCNMVIDHKCQELPISEFYSNKMCKPYWEVEK